MVNVGWLKQAVLCKVEQVQAEAAPQGRARGQVTPGRVLAGKAGAGLRYLGVCMDGMLPRVHIPQHCQLAVSFAQAWCCSDPSRHACLRHAMAC